MINFLFFFFCPLSLWDLRSPPGTEVGPLAVRAQSPNHWTSGEFPDKFFYLNLRRPLKSVRQLTSSFELEGYLRDWGKKQSREKRKLGSWVRAGSSIVYITKLTSKEKSDKRQNTISNMKYCQKIFTKIFFIQSYFSLKCIISTKGNILQPLKVTLNYKHIKYIYTSMY